MTLKFRLKQPTQGFILVVTLLIITVISVLVVTSMQHILLYYKAINRQEVLHQRFYQLENVASQLAHAKLTSLNRSCIVDEDAANQVMNNLLHQKGCSLADGVVHYQYLIEDLGEFSCLITLKQGQKHATLHRRVSVVQIQENIPTSFLQIRFITVGGMANCLSQEHFIPLGTSSWRYLPSI